METLSVVLVAFVAVVVVRMIYQRGSSNQVMAEVEQIQLVNLSELNTLFEDEKPGKQLLFLHDPWCPISARAARQVASFGKPVHLIDVSTQHDLRDEVEMRTGIRHESPQAIVFADGRPFWFASHSRITAIALTEAWDTPDLRPKPGPELSGPDDFDQKLDQASADLIEPR